jgi:hypothetical protein
MTTAAVITRAHLIEGPYLNEFIAWYLALGFSTIYFVHTEPAKLIRPASWSNLAKLKSWIDPTLLERVRFLPHAGPVDTFPYARRAFSSVISEDYVLHVDCDEFLVLPGRYRRVGDFLDENPASLHVFHWFCVPVKRLFQHSMLDYLKEDDARYKNADARKMMVSRRAWLADRKAEMHPHRFDCQEAPFDHKDDGTGASPFVIHFIVRSYIDTLVRILHQRFKNDQRNLKHFLSGDIDPSLYPQRFSLALGECFSANDRITADRWNIQPVSPPPVDGVRIREFISDSLGDFACPGVDHSQEDPYDLVAKMERGLSALHRAKCPISEHSGFKYNKLVREALSKLAS